MIQEILGPSTGGHFTIENLQLIETRSLYFLFLDVSRTLASSAPTVETK
jgi:hypothetical protein